MMTDVNHNIRAFDWQMEPVNHCRIPCLEIFISTFFYLLINNNLNYVARFLDSVQISFIQTMTQQWGGGGGGLLWWSCYIMCYIKPLIFLPMSSSPSCFLWNFHYHKYIIVQTTRFTRIRKVQDFSVFYNALLSHLVACKYVHRDSAFNANNLKVSKW